jgi:hypothetical protein
VPCAGRKKQKRNQQQQARRPSFTVPHHTHVRVDAARVKRTKEDVYPSHTAHPGVKIVFPALRGSSDGGAHAIPDFQLYSPWRNLHACAGASRGARRPSGAPCVTCSLAAASQRDLNGWPSGRHELRCLRLCRPRWSC